MTTIEILVESIYSDYPCGLSAKYIPIPYQFNSLFDAYLVSYELNDISCNTRNTKWFEYAIKQKCENQTDFYLIVHYIKNKKQQGYYKIDHIIDGFDPTWSTRYCNFNRIINVVPELIYHNSFFVSDTSDYPRSYQLNMFIQDLDNLAIKNIHLALFPIYQLDQSHFDEIKKESNVKIVDSYSNALIYTFESQAATLLSLKYNIPFKKIELNS